MGRKFKGAGDPRQLALMPVSADLRDLLPGRHLAWGVLEQVALLDMSAFEVRYRADGQGGRPYDPRMVCGLLLYCYCEDRSPLQ